MKKIIVALISCLVLFSGVYGVKAVTMPNIAYNASATEDNGMPMTSKNEVLYGVDLFSLMAAGDFKENFILDYEATADIGLSYILDNGYPNVSIFDNAEIDYQTTAMAVVVYRIKNEDIDTDNEDVNSMYASFEEWWNNADMGEDFDTAKAYVETLVNEAIEFKNNYTSDLEIMGIESGINLSSSSKYYESDLIKVSMAYGTSYRIELTSAPNGTTIVDENGNQKTEFNVDEGFRVRVPVSKSNIFNVRFNVQVEAAKNQFYIYKSRETLESLGVAPGLSREVSLDDRYYNVVLATPYTQTFTKEQNVTLEMGNNMVAVPYTGSNISLIIFAVGLGIVAIASIIIIILTKKKKA